MASASLILGAFAAAPAEAKKKKKKPAACAPFSAVEPDSNSGETAEATEAKVVPVTAAATEESPVVIEYEHGPAVWETETQSPIVEDTQFFNFQVTGASGGLHLRMEWPGIHSDIDMYLYDEKGTRVASSGAFNPAPVPGVFDAGGNGGMGFESIPGYAANDCAGFTVESRAFYTPGEPMTLKVWMGAPGTDIPE